MLGALQNLKRPSRPVGGVRGPSRRVPRGMRVYAVGDLHGRADLLEEMLDAIAADAAERPRDRRVLVFLGDYIDRGPSSAAVLDRLTGLRDSDPDCFFLLGNHEEALLRILGGDHGLIDDWLRFGGKECLASYGVDVEPSAGTSPAALGALIIQAIPDAHRDFLQSCDDSVTIGDYLFVHAGIRPGAPLSAQRQRDLRWIREPFLSCGDDHGAVVVHGHSISEGVDWRDNRIGVDTGAYRSGILSALVLSGSRRRALQVKGATG